MKLFSLIFFMMLCGVLNAQNDECSCEAVGWFSFEQSKFTGTVLWEDACGDSLYVSGVYGTESIPLWEDAEMVGYACKYLGRVSEGIYAKSAPIVPSAPSFGYGFPIGASTSLPDISYPIAMDTTRIGLLSGGLWIAGDTRKLIIHPIDSSAVKWWYSLLFNYEDLKLSIKFVDGDAFKVDTYSKYDIGLTIGKDLVRKSYNFKGDSWAYVFSKNYQSTCNYCIHFDWKDNDFWIEPDGRIFWNKKLLQKDFGVYLNLIEYLKEFKQK